MNSLNRNQALSLLHAVVDNETTEREKKAFFEFIENHPDVKREYEETRHLKYLLSEKLQRKKAPEHLRLQILQKIEKIEINELRPPSEEPDFVQKNFSPAKTFFPYLNPALRYASAAAVVLIITVFTFQLLDRIIQTQSGAGEGIIENLATQHFISSDGQFIEPLYETDSTLDAENYLTNHYDMEISVPGINGAQFAGIAIVDFLDGFETPMLEYTQNDLGETIYLFIFDVDEVDSNSLLERHKKAVETCIQEHDFYVAEIDSFHSVSWLWGNTWYTAVSNHNGYDLASLIEPLNYSP